MAIWKNGKKATIWKKRKKLCALAILRASVFFSCWRTCDFLYIQLKNWSKITSSIFKRIMYFTFLIVCQWSRFLRHDTSSIPILKTASVRLPMENIFLNSLWDRCPSSFPRNAWNFQFLGMTPIYKDNDCDFRRF